MTFKCLFAVASIAAVLTVAYAALTRRILCLEGKNSAINAECCQLFALRDDLQQNLFHGGLCTAEAHESLRLTFNDAIAISPALEAQGQFGGGGADGSIAIFADVETGYHANIGLDEIIQLQQPILARHNISVADFIQFAGAVGLSNCPGAPQLTAFVGRKDATQPAPDNLIPEPFDTADRIFARLSDASNGAFDVIHTVWLLAAHTVAAANDIDPTVPGAPLDSTPSLFDTQFFVETLLRGTSFPGTGGNQGEVESAVKGTLRLQSDDLIARDSRTACEWQSFVNNQAKAQMAFKSVFQTMSTLGQNLGDLVNCTEVVPVPPPPQGTAHFPAGTDMGLVEQACAQSLFPTLPTNPGPPTTVAPVPLP
ncbi:lignin peroxidase isozyme [Cubamyces sp. BRFM 1775]|nr:lignin peroxidase isozyme [Cubamyces sp. BRFM 1775]